MILTFVVSACALGVNANAEANAKAHAKARIPTPGKERLVTDPCAVDFTSRANMLVTIVLR
jgi:hypothetical protein